jgi:hypothetical protein
VRPRAADPARVTASGPIHRRIATPRSIRHRIATPGSIRHSGRPYLVLLGALFCCVGSVVAGWLLSV